MGQIGEAALRILQEQGIECVTVGKNVRPGNFALPCPWCGDDPSQHLSVRLDTGIYGCWRSPDHKGGKVANVLMQALGWSFQQAQMELNRATGIGSENNFASNPELDNFENHLYTHLRVPDSQAGTAQGVKLDIDGGREAEFKKLLKHSMFRSITPVGSTKPFWKYIKTGRGFGADTQAVIDRYDLKACLAGEYTRRLVIPFIEEGRWVSFTARAIDKFAELRYKTLQNSRSLIPPRHTIFNYDTVVQGGKMLVVTEGPLDAMKVDFYGRALGVCGTCIYSVSISEQQIYKLQLASKRFQNIVVILDREFELHALSVASVIGTPTRVEKFRGKRGVKDFGDMDGKAIRHYLKQRMPR